MDTSLLPTLWYSGSTNPNQYPFASMQMTLEYNIRYNSFTTTSPKELHRNSGLVRGKAVVSPSTGNITMDMLMCQSQVLFKNHLKIFSINHQNHPNFHQLKPLNMSNLSRDNANMHQNQFINIYPPRQNYKGAKNNPQFALL